MAKPKQETIVQEFPGGCIHIWTSEPEKEIEAVKRIEGVTFAGLGNGQILVTTDPRYDQKEIAEEIRELLKSPIPDIFKAD